jgi:hypothetical protein
MNDATYHLVATAGSYLGGCAFVLFRWWARSLDARLTTLEKRFGAMDAALSRLDERTKHL